MSGKPTHYDVLGVSKYATYEEIKQSFHRLARAKHPDKQIRQNPQQTNRTDSELESSNNHYADQGGDNEIGGNPTVAEFRQIQQAWQVLRDEEERSAYDSDLLHKDLQEENKRNGAIVLSFHDDLEEAVDEDTNEHFMVYDCRCGEEIHIDMSPSSVSESDAEDDFARCKTANGDGDHDDDDIFVDCPGCCFVYRIVNK